MSTIAIYHNPGCGTSRNTLGVKSCGRAPTFLMATGFEQARSVVAAIGRG